MSNVFYANLDKKYKCVERAEGSWVYDTDGKKYLDCAAGIAVTNIGQGIKEVIDAMYQQASNVSYVYGGTFTSEAKERLSHQIIELSPEGMDKVFFCSGGSEAVESMGKIARQYQIEAGRPGKYKIISRWQSYHGNTIATLTYGGRPSWREKYDNYLMKMPHIAQCNCYRCPYGLSYPECGLPCAEELERIIKYEGPDTVAAFLIEPIVGTTSCATMPPIEYMKRIREICDKYNVLFCVDEVITGFGRTGKNFAMDHFGIVPDLISVAKGLGGGYVPIGAVIAHKKVVDAFEKGSKNLIHSFTFAGNPLVCAGASAVLSYTVNNNLVERAAKEGEVFMGKLKEALGDSPLIGDIRGVGMLIGVELVMDREKKEPFDPEKNVSGFLAGYCFDHGLLISSGVTGTADGIAGEALQISPPLILDEEEMDFAVDILKTAVLEAEHRFL